MTKGLEAFSDLTCNYPKDYVKSYNIVLNYIKALEIIKKKGVFVHLLQQSQNMEEYNSLMLIAFKKMAEKDYKSAVEKFCLTKEEFDLLKNEVVEHE